MRSFSKIRISLFSSIVAMVISSCNPRQEGTSVEATEAQEVSNPIANATKIPVDTTMSVITWIGSKPSGQHNGIIAIQDGFVAIHNDQIVGGNIVIDIQSLKIMDIEPGSDGYSKLKNHLMSDDFFDTANFPTGTFELTDIIPFDSAKLSAEKDQYESEYTPASLNSFMVKNPTHIFSGNLTLRGITKNISFPAEVKLYENMLKAEAKFNINRTDWNLSYGDESTAMDKAKDKFIYNTVNVGFSLEAKE